MPNIRRLIQLDLEKRKMSDGKFKFKKLCPNSSNLFVRMAPKLSLLIKICFCSVMYTVQQSYWHFNGMLTFNNPDDCSQDTLGS